MITISQTYFMLKKETGAEFARKTLIDNLKMNKGNIKQTAGEMKCSRNTIYLALEKETEKGLKDKPHTPKTVHPNTTPEALVETIIKK